MIPTLGLSSLLYLCNCIAFILWASCIVSINLFQPSQKSESIQELNCYWNGILRNPLVKIWRKKKYFSVSYQIWKQIKLHWAYRKRLRKKSWEILFAIWAPTAWCRRCAVHLTESSMSFSFQNIMISFFQSIIISFFSKPQDLFLSVYNYLFLFKTSWSLSFSL